jgi:hypothetical protein
VLSVLKYFRLLTANAIRSIGAATSCTGTSCFYLTDNISTGHRRRTSYYYERYSAINYFFHFIKIEIFK